MGHDNAVMREQAAMRDASKADSSSTGPTSRAPLSQVEGHDPIAATARPAGVRGLHPGWFGAVMGTAIVAVAASLNPGHTSSMVATARTVSQVMTLIAAGLGVILLVLFVSRFARHGDAALADLRDPGVGALYGTVPGAILVLAAATAAVGPTWFAPSTVRDLVEVLDWIGIPLALVVSLVFAQTLFLRASLAAEAVNGSWFIPPVVNIVVPLVLVPLVPGSSPAVARTLLFLSYGFWGMGFMLYLIIIAMLYQRLVLHPLPHAGLAPSLWIGLGPIGVGSLALLKLAAAGGGVFGNQAATVALASKLVATALWGFGAWWFLVATTLLVHYLRAGSLPYGIGWWGFTFPLGAYTVATLALAQAWSLSSLQWVGASLFVVLVVFWIVVVIRTLVALGTGEFTRDSRPTPTSTFTTK